MMEYQNKSLLLHHNYLEIHVVLEMKRLFWLISILVSLSASAQDVQTVEAEYVYEVPEDVSLAAAKQTALEKAKIRVIAETYGTVVSESNTVRMANRNGISSVDFLSIGGSDVKGEWIETIGQPEYQINYNGDRLIVAVIILHIPVSNDPAVIRVSPASLSRRIVVPAKRPIIKVQSRRFVVILRHNASELLRIRRII